MIGRSLALVLAVDDPNQPVPPLRQHQFGASLGGPAAARMFFFAHYEGQRLHRSLTQTFSVPSLALRRPPDAVGRQGDLLAGTELLLPSPHAHALIHSDLHRIIRLEPRQPAASEPAAGADTRLAAGRGRRPGSHA